MNGRRWFGMHPLFVLWILFLCGRRAIPWIVENLQIFLPGLMIAGPLMVLIWAVFKRVPNPSPPKPEVAFVESPPRLGPVALREGARCLVCRDPLSGDVIYCGQCHTPHHRACYSYVGGCSVYACASRKAG